MKFSLNTFTDFVTFILSYIILCSYCHGKNECLGIVPESIYFQRENSELFFTENFMKKYSKLRKLDVFEFLAYLLGF